MDASCTAEVQFLSFSFRSRFSVLITGASGLPPLPGRDSRAGLSPGFEDSPRAVLFRPWRGWAQSCWFPVTIGRRFSDNVPDFRTSPGV
jgi:hypothetical protein